MKIEPDPHSGVRVIFSEAEKELGCVDYSTYCYEKAVIWTLKQVLKNDLEALVKPGSN